MRILLFALTALLCISCAVKDATRPAEPAGFIERKEGPGVVTDLYPFDYVWINKDERDGLGYPKTHYSKIIITEINLDYIDQNHWRDSLSSSIRSKESYDRRLGQVAEYMQTSLRKAFSKRKKFEVVKQPGAETAAMEIAFTQVVFGDPVAYTGAFAVPLPGTSHMFDSARSPMIAIETKLYDSQTGVLLSAAADRKFPRVKIVDLNKFTVMSPMREVVNRWTVEITDSLHKKLGENVTRTWSFTLAPW